MPRTLSTQVTRLNSAEARVALSGIVLPRGLRSPRLAFYTLALSVSPNGDTRRVPDELSSCLTPTKPLGGQQPVDPVQTSSSPVVPRHHSLGPGASDCPWNNVTHRRHFVGHHRIPSFGRGGRITMGTKKKKNSCTEISRCTLAYRLAVN